MTSANIIPINTGIIGGISQQTVDARLLHKVLEVKRDFTNWIKTRILKYDFVENQDYRVYAKSGENLLGGRPSQEYELSTGMSKELCMVENNDKGKLTRRYFIECERKKLTSQPLPLPTLTASTPADRKPLVKLTKLWAKLTHQKFSACWIQLDSAFQLMGIKELPKELIPDAIAWVQSKIDALPKALPEAQQKADRLLQIAKKNRFVHNNPLIDALIEHYDLEGLDSLNITSYKLKETLNTYPNIGEHTLNAILVKAKYIAAVHKVFKLGKAIQSDLHRIAYTPVLEARNKIATTGKNLTLDSFTETMFASSYNFANTAEKFCDDFSRLINFYINLAMMQDL